MKTTHLLYISIVLTTILYIAYWRINTEIPLFIPEKTLVGYFYVITVIVIIIWQFIAVINLISESCNDKDDFTWICYTSIFFYVFASIYWFKQTLNYIHKKLLKILDDE